MSLQANDFELFDLPPRFAQDEAQLQARWKALQRQAHPDRFASEGAAAQRVAMQWSVRINEAYRRLLDPLARAAYLCELRGAPVQAESNTQMPAAFLMQQMAWREALDDDDSPAGLEALRQEVQAERTRLLDLLATQLDTQDDASAAVSSVRGLMFVNKFLRELHERLDR
ncbi:MAG: Fe-S protein assembly co-chaperone HscB [Limnohabitans sp.]